MVKAASKIPILAIGKGWLVVDKPAGLTVHNTPGKDLCALVKAILEDSSEAKQMIHMDPAFGLHPVHRLDKETSGLVLMAVDPATFHFLSQQFESHQVKKEYVAIVHGSLEQVNDEGEWGVWSWPLSKTAGGRRNPQGTGHRKPSTTRYRVKGVSSHYSMVDISLMTGRKHQIRRHTTLAGHPVVGDLRYGSARAVKYLKENHKFYRLGLHAAALTFLTPDAKEEKTVRTLDIPKQMKDLFFGDK